MVCLIDLLIRLLRAVVQLHATGRLLRLRSRGYGRVPPASKFGRLDGLGATRRIAAERDLATTDVLMIRVLLAEDQAMVRGALTALLTLECDIAVVSEVDRGDLVMEAAVATQPGAIPTPPGLSW